MHGQKLVRATRTHSLCGVVFSIAVLIGGSVTVCAGQLPEEIAGYYHTVNFINSFSTPQERAGLFQGQKVSREITAASPLSERLKKVQVAMDRIRDRVWKADPGIEFKSFAGGAMPRAQLFRVLHFSRSENIVMVRVNVFPLNPEYNRALISRYENRSKSDPLPSDQDRLAQVEKNAVPETELHFWFKVNGRWVLNKSKIGLLR